MKVLYAWLQSASPDTGHRVMQPGLVLTPDGLLCPSEGGDVLIPMANIKSLRLAPAAAEEPTVEPTVEPPKKRGRPPKWKRSVEEEPSKS